MSRGISESWRPRKKRSSSFHSDIHLLHAGRFAAEMSIFGKSKKYIRIKATGGKVSELKASWM